MPFTFLQMPHLFIALGFVLSWVICKFLLPQILFISHKKRLYDLPDERKRHTHPIPRLGGLAFTPAILIAFSLIIALRIRFSLPINASESDATLLRLLALMSGMIFLYFIGLADDIVGLNHRKKFLAQLFASALLAFSGNFFNNFYGFLGIYKVFPWVGIPVAIFTIVYITNAINLIDGIDGLSAGLSALALAAFTFLFAFEQQYYNSLIAACSLGVIFPFGHRNIFGDARRGKKLFMGDTGSLTLGFVLSYLAISACRMTPVVYRNKTDVVIAFSILFIPLIDVVRVVVHRLRHGKHPFLPDRNHIHHKLLRTGLSPRSVLVTILVYCLFFFILNIVLSNVINLNITWIVLLDLVLWTVSQSIFTLIANRRGAREKKGTTPLPIE